MKPRQLALAIAALCAAGAFAADQIGTTTESSFAIADAGGAHRAFAFAGTPEMFHGGDWSRFMALEMGDHGRVVKDAPYSAEAVTETTQVLGDGNRISKRTVALLYRDAAGRTRQEQTAPGSRVFINDPVSGRHIVLSVERKTAQVMPGAGRIAANIDIEKLKEMAKEKAKARIIHKGLAGDTHIVEKSADGTEVQIINEPGRQIVIKRKEIDRGDGTRRVEENKEVRISVVRAHGGDDSVAIAGLPIDLEGLMSMRAGKHKGVTTSLGSKEVGGVKAEGTQTIATIPAGEIGNEKPIQIISEKWFSPELQAVVYSRQSDPRTGETIYRLNNIRRVAQPPELFAVPAGYTIKESRMTPIPPIPPVPPLAPPAPAAPAPPAAPR